MASIDWKTGLSLLQRLPPPAQWARAVPYINVLLIILLGYSVAVLTWALVPPAAQERLPAGLAQRPVPAATAASKPVPSKDIAALHLFGMVDTSAPVAAAPVIVETTLKLELRGILGSSDSTLARAIIAEPGRDENFYAVGASVPGGATVKEIQSDQVILARGGRLETLRLPKERLEGANSIEAPAPVSPSRGAAPAGMGGAASELTGDESLRELRDTLVRDPQMLAGLMQAEPVFENNAIAGFRLGQGQDPRLLRRFGLQRGDVVTSINDIQLDGPAKLPELLRSLPTASELRIEYKRNGKPRSIVLNMEQ